ncbi:MAG: hypothetical protein U1E50_11785 [Caulobacteraceae bacterium]
MRWSVGLLLALALAGPANADDWWFFSRTGAMRTYMDMDSITPAAEGVRTVTLRRYDPSLSRSLDGIAIFEFEERWEVDCGAARARVVFAAIYGRDGAQVRAEAGEGEWISGAPGTNTELMLHVLCENDRLELHDAGAKTAAELRQLVLSGQGL